MSTGDTLNNVTNIAAGARLTFQPGAGQVFLIYGCYSSAWVGAGTTQSPNIVVELYDGANYSEVYRANNNPEFMKRLKLLINNSIYLTVLNLSGVAENLGYSGIRVK